MPSYTSARTSRLLVFAAACAALAYMVAVPQWTGTDELARTYLDKSVPFVGTDIARVGGIDGDGIVVAVIDTGVDYNHPDLLGWGPDGKIIGGYNFVDEGQLPLDTNGHGTQVAGVIAADGSVTGVAPKAKILAYKVSEDGEGVSPDLIIRAIDMAVHDGADIINISLGINKTSSRIERAVDRALDEGIFVVTAAGNNGPGAGSIGSPGSNRGSVTVGATYNNLPSSLVATLEIAGEQYTVIPMNGSPQPDGPIRSAVIPAGHAGTADLDGIDAAGRILIVERGSADGELLYFSEKESNAADAGAVALIVYNNKPGIFLGELRHPFAGSGYEPRIPVVSIDRKSGLEIIGMPDGQRRGAVHLFYNPDFVAHFSSRGPVSPFYIKPDLVAPGAYINTTRMDSGYDFASGTSYAAPHVSGAAALLMQKNPDIDHRGIKSLLMTTAMPVSDEYGDGFSLHDSGAGRLDVARAFGAGLVIYPPSLVVGITSYEPSAGAELGLESLGGDPADASVAFEGPDFVTFSSKPGNPIKIRLDASGGEYGSHEAHIRVTHDGMEYAVPMLIHYTEGMVDAVQQGDSMIFDIRHPQGWSFAKITATNSLDGTSQTATATPARQGLVDVSGNATYWVEANIRVDGESYDAFSTIDVSAGPSKDSLPEIPYRQAGLVSGIILAVGLAGLLLRRTD